MEFSQTIPFWFVRWWDDFGPVSEILPPIAQNAFNLFISKYQPPKREPPYPLLLHFFIMTGLTWVSAWSLEYQPRGINDPVKVLCRRFRTKWWDGFSHWHKIADKTILDYTTSLKTQVSLPTATDPAHTAFLHDKALAVSQLAGAKHPEEVYAILKKVVASYEESQAASSTASSSHHSGNTNEDDCYGIDLARDTDEE